MFGRAGINFGRMGAIPPLWTLAGASLDLDFVGNRGWVTGAGQVGASALLTTTRNSVAWADNEAGVWSSFAVNTPRITNKGLLVEEASTNVVLHNRDLTSVAWTASNVTAAKDQVGVDGVANSASSILATANAGTITQAITLASSARWQSVFAKRLVGAGTLEMSMDGGTTYTDITPTGAEWQRKAIATQTLANPEPRFRIQTDTDKFAIDFVQNENGTFAASPIAVTTVAVARSADVITRLGTISLAGTLYAEVMIPAHPTGASNFTIFGADNNGATERVDLMTNTAGATVNLFSRNAAGIQVSITSANTYSLGTAFKVAGAYAQDDAALSLSGGTVGTDTSGDVSSLLDRFRLGSRAGTTVLLNGYLRRVAYFPTRLSNAQIKALTA